MLGLTAIVMSVGTANAPLGDFHNGASLVCSDCHVMHGEQSHGYNPDGTGFFAPVGAGGPFHYLLRDEINNLCLSCHNNNSVAPDVLDANTGKYPGEVRLAGYLNEDGGVGLDATGHTLGSLDIAPGSSPAWNSEVDNGAGEGLNCVNCHAQHGYAGGANTYRNLVDSPGNHGFLGAVVDYSTGTNDLLTDVFQVAALSYDWPDVNFNEPSTTESAYGNWCGGCHTNFHGAAGGANIGGTANGASWSALDRHPVAGVDIGAIGGGHSSLVTFAGHTNRVKVMSATGVWDGSVGDVTPSCFSCHKAHGNGNAFGLIFMSGTGTIDEEGDDGLTPKDLCGQCHVQG